MFDKLSAPFPPEVIHWRAQTLSRDGSKALALAYLDARDVMDRLDEACGPAGWQSSITETPSGRVLCTLSIFHEGQWISKTDGAGSTAVEGEKGGISDALKRAAVLWGVGRYLYDLGNVWAPCEIHEANGKKQWKAWKPEAKRLFANALAGVEHSSPQKSSVRQVADAPATLTDAQRDEIMLMASGLKIPIGKLIGKYNKANPGANAQSLADIPQSEFEPMRSALLDITQKRAAEKKEAA